MVLRILRVLVVSLFGVFAKAFYEPHRLIRPTVIEADDVRLIYDIQRHYIPMRDDHHLRGVDVSMQPTLRYPRKEEIKSKAA